MLYIHVKPNIELYSYDVHFELLLTYARFCAYSHKNSQIYLILHQYCRSNLVKEAPPFILKLYSVKLFTCPSLSVNEVDDDRPEKKATDTMGGGFSFGTAKPGSGKRTLKAIKTHFYVGTEDGEIVYVDWMPQKDQDSGKIQSECD